MGWVWVEVLPPPTHTVVRYALTSGVQAHLWRR